MEKTVYKKPVVAVKKIDACALMAASGETVTGTNVDNETNASPDYTVLGKRGSIWDDSSKGSGDNWD